MLLALLGLALDIGLLFQAPLFALARLLREFLLLLLDFLLRSFNYKQKLYEYWWQPRSPA